MSRPKLNPLPIGEKDVSEYLETTDDFRLELDVFRACRESGFRADHGGSYRDPVTGLNRQYDVRAFHMEDCRCLRLAIECKNLSPCFPLLVSRIPRRRSESYHTLLISYPNGAVPNYISHRVKYSYFKLDQPVGKAATQIGRSKTNDNEFVVGNSEVHEKWSQAIASSHELVWDARTDYYDVEKRFQIAATLIQPILIVADGTLWVADYDERGDLTQKPSLVEECSIYLNTLVSVSDEGISVRYPVSHLLVFTKSGFEAFIAKLGRSNDFRENFTLGFSEIRDIAKAELDITL